MMKAVGLGELGRRRQPHRRVVPAPPGLLADVVVLVYCESCGRFIAHEDRHGCVLAGYEDRHRTVQRMRKTWELAGI